MKQLIFRVATSVLAMILPVIMFAQDGPPGFGNGVSDVGGGGGGAGVPIDGGLGLLIAAGVGYGVKKYVDSRKAAGQKEVSGK